jgi:hypothetical protein
MIPAICFSQSDKINGSWRWDMTGTSVAAEDIRSQCRSATSLSAPEVIINTAHVSHVTYPLVDMTPFNLFFLIMVISILSTYELIVCTPTVLYSFLLHLKILRSTPPWEIFNDSQDLIRSLANMSWEFVKIALRRYAGCSWSPMNIEVRFNQQVHLFPSSWVAFTHFFLSLSSIKLPPKGRR